MNKRKTLCLISLSCYVLFAVAATILAISTHIELNRLNSTPQEGFEGLAGIFLAVFMVLGYAYAIASLVPILLKTFHVFFDKTVLGILCMIFDVAYIGVHTAFVISAIGGLSAEAIAAFLLLLVILALSVVSLIANILALREHGKNYI